MTSAKALNPEKKAQCNTGTRLRRGRLKNRAHAAGQEETSERLEIKQKQIVA